ncbi:ULK/ULK protein kinase [Puccinia graminis f. sp. tritici CRL 75-36-700-3]|uniref:non-specific serine/threonine protein kinase n=1 Tax=Puccinia graminis f. sp. tritici (strain CRL 75-36-700-3 / race SCCL) TaxID=418459 RepID=E3KNN2_PUCGT|nr:ULK/ULK protein kinase [Puccinia graminis f. sp. tritici CRL 75-36-700-3]EFP85907.2 ULK/ULK protein kinase [Puccinia graminis f. sp. tritici CRL 75-36-700-3]
MSPPPPNQTTATGTSTTATGSSSSRQHEIPGILPGGFTIGEEIGRGSFAVVYRGLNPRTNQTVAIKAVIKSKLTNKLFQNLQDEIKILKKIRHGNVVGLVDCLSNNDYIFLIMQYCSQGDLSVYIKTQAKLIKQQQQPQPHQPFPHPQDGGLNEWIIRSFLGQLADALRFLRSHSIIHRDIKPQNLLLHPSSQSSQPSTSDPKQPDSFISTTSPRYIPEGIPILRVADFGFARVLAPNAGLAETLCGSPLYMAPEILRYEKYDAKADLWSVGAVLFEMAVGKPPFRAQNHVELLRKIEKSEDKIAFPEEKVVAQDLKRLILSLLKRNPAERVSFEEFFLMADEVSRVGPLIPPTQPPLQQQQQQPSSLPRTTSIPLRPQLTTLHSTSVQAHENLSPRPPSTSTLPNPTALKGKSHQPVSANPFDGEPGAFIVDKNSSAYKPKQPLPPPFSQPNQSGSTDRAPQNRQVSLPPAFSNSHAGHPGFQAPSPSLLPTPQPSGQRQSSWMPSFPAKYIVPGSSTSNPTNLVSTAVKSKDYALMRSPSLNSPSKQNTTSAVPFKTEEDEDRDLGTEYVVVEKGSVEINAMVDGLSSSPQKPMSLGRRMSRGFMAAKPTLTGLSSSPHRTTSSGSPPHSSLATHSHSSPVSSFPPRPHTLTASPIPTGSHPMNIANFGRSSPSSQGHYGPHPSSPRSFDSGGGGIGSLPLVGKYFPQAVLGTSSPSGPAAPSHTSAGPSGSQAQRPPFTFPSSALSRAILSAGPLQINHQTIPTRSIGGPSTSQPPPRSSASRNGHLDPVESQLLAELEEFACKALVIIHFADQKLAAILPPPPSASGPSASSTSNPAPFSGPVGAFITSSPSSYPSFDPSTSSSSTSSSSSCYDLRHSSTLDTPSSVLSKPPSGQLAPAASALAAGQALLLYIKALAFLNKSIRHAVAVVDWKKLAVVGGGGNALSYETSCAIEWLRHKFNEVFDKIQFVKTKANGKSLLSTGGRVLSADKLIYDRALEKSRSAAVNELGGDSRLKECELEYESSLWMLYGLMDERIIQTDSIFELDRPVLHPHSHTTHPHSHPHPHTLRPRKAEVPVCGAEDDLVDDVADEQDRDNEEEEEDDPIASQHKFIKRSCPNIIRSILVRLDSLRTKLNHPSPSSISHHHPHHHHSLHIPSSSSSLTTNTNTHTHGTPNVTGSGSGGGSGPLLSSSGVDANGSAVFK